MNEESYFFETLRRVSEWRRSGAARGLTQSGQPPPWASPSTPPRCAYQCWIRSSGSVSQRYGSEDPDPHQNITDPTPDPTPFFGDFKDAKNYVHVFFFYNLPAGTLFLVLKI